MCKSLNRKNNVDKRFYFDNNYWYKDHIEELKLFQKSVFVYFDNFILDGNSVEFGAADGDFIYLVKNKFNNRICIYSEIISMMRKEYTNIIEQKICSFEEYNEVKKFSNIFMINVIEHLNNPLEAIKKINNMLVPGGLFFAVTDNGDIFNAYDRILHHQEHCFILTKKGIEQLASSVNMNVFKTFINPTGFIYFILQKRK